MDAFFDALPSFRRSRVGGSCRSGSRRRSRCCVVAIEGSRRNMANRRPQNAAGQKVRDCVSPHRDNTALVESFGDPAKQVTETIYHRDGDHLLATHYCAQGNQPRLRLKPSPRVHELLFEFHDATNLKNVADSHFVRIEFEIVNSNRLIRREVYLENGKEHESTLVLVRSIAATPAAGYPIPVYRLRPLT